MIETIRASNDERNNSFDDGYIGCEWVNETLNVFDNPKEKLSFNYRHCDGLEKIQKYGYNFRFHIDEGRYLYFERLPLDPKYSNARRGSPIMGIWKNDALEEEAFLDLLMNKEVSGCVARRFHKDIWRVGLSEEEFSARNYAFRDLNEPRESSSSSDKTKLIIHTEDTRFPYSMPGECSQLGVDWEYVFRDGIVFGYSPYLVNTQFYDLNSITYIREK